jgi:DoxX-like family
MRARSITYWTATLIISLTMFFIGYQYITEPDFAAEVTNLGFPSYFRIELALAHEFGALALVLPFREGIKEWAYAGFSITFISAVIAHAVSGDPITIVIKPLIFMAILSVSYYGRYKLRNIFS